MPTRTSRPKSEISAKMRKNHYLAPQKENYFSSNKNSKKDISSRSRRDVPETEELIQKFVDTTDNGPLENRDFFFNKCKKSWNELSRVLLKSSAVTRFHWFSLVFTRFHSFSPLSIRRTCTENPRYHYVIQDRKIGFFCIICSKSNFLQLYKMIFSDLKDLDIYVFLFQISHFREKMFQTILRRTLLENLQKMADLSLYVIQDRKIGYFSIICSKSNFLQL